MKQRVMLVWTKPIKLRMIKWRLMANGRTIYVGDCDYMKATSFPKLRCFFERKVGKGRKHGIR